MTHYKITFPPDEWGYAQCPVMVKFKSEKIARNIVSLYQIRGVKGCLHILNQSETGDELIKSEEF